ncbi:hypothetical protein J437_LFUL006598 [Ladona fulva]|uniref:Uncharacterized protein n=1 Tax=Ladona fulva TaxID=123851 RepID=A0A8K0KGH7_LADFU|nr:hypothetical protein J437_LFUL006598 [Ladona fulva]
MDEWRVKDQSGDEGNQMKRTHITRSLLNSSTTDSFRRHHEAPISPGRLAHYTLALNAICRDPRRFHGHDLVGSLLHHESPSDQEFAIASLAACSSGAHVRKRQIRRLLDVADKTGAGQGGAGQIGAGDVDTLSTVLLALDCIVREHRNRNLEHYVKRPARGLARLQNPDGSFGSRTRSTALALQALAATWEEDPSWNHLSQESAPAWNRTAALLSLLSHQGSDGSFGGGDVVSTAEAALALAAKGGLGTIRNITCPSPPRPPSPLAAPGLGLPTDHASHGSAHEKLKDHSTETPTMATGNETLGDALVTYTLWVGSNISENLSLTLKAPANSSFYNLMLEAAQQDERFQFGSSSWPNGHYIHTIHGYREQPAAHRYWLLYRLHAVPDPSEPPPHHQLSPKGVDDLLVNNGDHFLFWYRKL